MSITNIGRLWWLSCKESDSAGGAGSIPRSERSPREGNSNTDFSILAWGIPWTEEPGGLQSMGLKKSGGVIYPPNNNNNLLNITPILLQGHSAGKGRKIWTENMTSLAWKIPWTEEPGRL